MSLSVRLSQYKVSVFLFRGIPRTKRNRRSSEAEREGFLPKHEWAVWLQNRSKGVVRKRHPSVVNGADPGTAAAPCYIQLRDQDPVAG